MTRLTKRHSLRSSHHVDCPEPTCTTRLAGLSGPGAVSSRVEGSRSGRVGTLGRSIKWRALHSERGSTKEDVGPPQSATSHRKMRNPIAPGQTTECRVREPPAAGCGSVVAPKGLSSDSGSNHVRTSSAGAISVRMLGRSQPRHRRRGRRSSQSRRSRPHIFARSVTPAHCDATRIRHHEPPAVGRDGRGTLG